MSQLCIDLHGVRVRVEGDPEAVDHLAHHFLAHRAEAPAAEATVSISLRRGRRLPGDGRRLVASQVLERGVVYVDGPVTWVDHHGRATSRYDFEAERGEVVAEAMEDLVELGYLMIHSRLGLLLEARGLHRIHCLGLEIGGRAVLVLAPSGGGKSTLALAALRETSCRVLGDDLVLVDAGGRVHPFHSPFGLPSEAAAAGLGRARRFARRHHRPKWTLELADLEPRLACEALPLAWVVEARRVTAPPARFVPLGLPAVAELLFRDLVVGLGLPQVLELVARRGARDIPRLGPVAARRLAVLAGLLGRARGARLEVHTPEAAVLLLTERCARDA